MRKIAIIDYGSGNLHSAHKAVVKVAGDAKVVVTKKADDIANATHIILPGVGAFGDCIANLKASNLIDILEQKVLHNNTPFLGICVGMQLLSDEGHENGKHKGLGWIPGKVVKLADADNIKIPHMGWNDITIIQPNQLTDTNKDFYFVHSYKLVCNDKSNILATTNYGQEITAIVNKNNIYGVQFHPEKSQDAGLELLQNFISL